MFGVGVLLRLRTPRAPCNARSFRRQAGVNFCTNKFLWPGMKRPIRRYPALDCFAPPGEASIRNSTAKFGRSEMSREVNLELMPPSGRQPAELEGVARSAGGRCSALYCGAPLSPAAFTIFAGDKEGHLNVSRDKAPDFLARGGDSHRVRLLPLRLGQWRFCAGIIRGRWKLMWGGADVRQMSPG